MALVGKWVLYLRAELYHPEPGAEAEVLQINTLSHVCFVASLPEKGRFYPA